MPSWETPASDPTPADSNAWQLFMSPCWEREEDEEARHTTRLSYPFPQRFAPFREGRWPQPDEFQPVNLCDISSTGLALLLPERPTCARFVVELGVGSNVSQVLVQVIQVTSDTGPLLVEGETRRYRVGCEILAPGEHSS